MPRIRPLTENQRKDRAIQEQLAGKMKVDKMTRDKLAQVLGISVQTLYRRMENPENWTLREMRILKSIFPGMVIE